MLKNTNSAEWIKFVSAPLVAYCTDEKKNGISNLGPNLLPENDIKKWKNMKQFSCKIYKPSFNHTQKSDFFLKYTTV